MPAVGRLSRILSAALVSAALGFSWALATSPASVPAHSRSVPSEARAKSRFAGQGLRYTSPFLAADPSGSNPLAGDPLYRNGGNADPNNYGYDLGDAALGGGLVRYLNVTGGFLPYTFALEPFLGSQNAGGPALPVSLPVVSRSGKLTCALDPLAGSVLRFKVKTSDLISTACSGLFKLNLMPPGTPFRMAQSQLPTGQAGLTYHTNLAVVSGVSPVIFSVVSSSRPLEEAGLTLSPDGMLFGRPVSAGTITLKVRAADASGAAARSRDGNSFDQSFLLVVEDNKTVTTEMAASACQIHGKLDGAGADSFAYAGLLDTKGGNAPMFAGSEFVFRLGGVVFSGTFDDKGKAALTAGNRGRFTLNLARNGSLKIKISNADLSAAFGGQDKSGEKPNAVMALEMPGFRTTEVLTMASPGARKGTHQMGYRLKDLSRGSLPAGAFQILSLSGQDVKIPDPEDPKAEPEAGDKWTVRCLGVPRAIDGSSAVAGASSVDVSIGDYTQTVTVTAQHNRLKFAAPGKSKDQGILSLQLDPRNFVHRIELNVLSQSETGMDAAAGSASKDGNIFPLGLSFGGFSGAAGRVMVPNGRRWIQK